MHTPGFRCRIKKLLIHTIGKRIDSTGWKKLVISFRTEMIRDQDVIESHGAAIKQSLFTGMAVKPEAGHQTGRFCLIGKRFQVLIGAERLMCIEGRKNSGSRFYDRKIYPLQVVL
jgi:hypothetical protein